MKRPRSGLLPALLLSSVLLLAPALAVHGQEAAEAEPPVPAELPEQAGGEAEFPEGLPPETAGEAAPEAPPVPELSPEQKMLDMDIRTSSLTELAAWCRRLGLSEGGGREELTGRIRDHYGIPPARETGGEKAITIESARTAEYFTLEAVEEEYARLRGNVVISLRDGEATHRIQAQEVLYNRTRNMVTATGGVLYIKEEGETVETFRGESITVNLDTWSGVFSDSVSERSLSGEQTTYRFAGTLITRSDEDTTVLTGAVITNAATDEPFWSISASKLWLLPGSDFAILNFMLKVGEIPVLWLPAFFWPSDEVIFHPVIGTRTREGSFVQTTTYILGRAQNTETTESSITKILGSSADMEKRREGIFLRSTGRRSQELQEPRLSVLLDAYTNLGVFTGMNLSLPGKALWGPMELFAGIGLSRNIYPPGGGLTTYTPFPGNDGESEWNESRFFSVTLPVRYRFKFSGSLSGIPGSFSWNFPYYSDPMVDRDFMNRSEAMDWMKMLQQGNVEDDTQAESSLLGTYSWQLSGNFNPRIKALSPFVTDLYFSNISSSLEFGRGVNTPPPMSISGGFAVPADSPDREFYFPRQFSIASISAVIRGTPLRLGGGSPGGTPSPGGERRDPLEHIGALPSPFEEPGEEAGEEPVPSNPAFDLSPPELGTRFDLARRGNAALSWAYQLNPSFSSSMDFRYSEWKTAENVSWDEVASVLSSLRTDGSTSITLNDSATGAYDFSLRLSGNLSWQDYLYMNEDAEIFQNPAGPNYYQRRNDAWRRVYNSRSFSTTGESAVTFRPLYWSPTWAATSLQYTLRGLVAKSIYRAPAVNNAVQIEDPVYDIEWGEWTKEKIELHQASTNISASVMDKVQSLSITTDLPPREMAVAGTAIFRVWISETNIRERIVEPFDEEKRKFEPLSITEYLRFAPRYYIQQSVTWDPELDDFTWFSAGINLAGFSASFTMSRATTYKLEHDILSQRWVWQGKDVLFSPREFRIGYAETFRRQKLFRDWLSLEFYVNTGFAFDLQRYTSSRFNFDLRLTLNITDFLDFSVSTSSVNERVFRYFQDWPIFDFPMTLPGETDFFTDLLNSFRFDNEALRKSSGFKLKSFTLSATHHMGDWSAKLGVTLSPYLDAAASRYSFNTQLSFLVQWVPIPEIKADIKYDREIWQTL